jgi:probable phosphoglycerate mutase
VSATVYLVRHGRTALNAEGRFRGRANPPLDEEGAREARAAAARLSGSGLAAVYASPLLRARQTAEAVAAAAGLAVAEAPELIDIDYGEWEALTPAEAAAKDPSAFATFMDRPLEAAVPGGEAVASVAERIMRTLHALARARDGGAVAAVSHELPIRLAVAAARGIEGGALWRIDLPTGAVMPLAVTDGELRPAGD